MRGRGEQHRQLVRRRPRAVKDHLPATVVALARAGIAVGARVEHYGAGDELWGTIESLHSLAAMEVLFDDGSRKILAVDDPETVVIASSAVEQRLQIIKNARLAEGVRVRLLPDRRTSSRRERGTIEKLSDDGFIHVFFDGSERRVIDPITTYLENIDDDERAIRRKWWTRKAKLVPGAWVITGNGQEPDTRPGMIAVVQKQNSDGVANVLWISPVSASYFSLLPEVEEPRRLSPEELTAIDPEPYREIAAYSDPVDTDHRTWVISGYPEGRYATKSCTREEALSFARTDLGQFPTGGRLVFYDEHGRKKEERVPPCETLL